MSVDFDFEYIPPAPSHNAARGASIVDDLLDRLSDQALLGDAELLSDLSHALLNVVMALDHLE